MLHHRHDEARGIERHGNADVVLLAMNEIGAVDGGVHHRVSLELRDHRLHDERQERELLSVLLLELLAHAGADARDTGEVDLEEAGDVGGDANRLRHVIRREATDLRHRLHDITRPDLRRLRVAMAWRRDDDRCRQRCRRCRNDADRRRCSRLLGRCRFDVRKNVALRDATRDAGTVDPGNFDAMLGGNLSHQWRRLRAEPLLVTVGRGSKNGRC